MAVKLFKYQEEVIQKLNTGSILCGGVGSGKSITAIAYYFVKENGGKLNPFKKLEAKKPLYIITTARKRDTLEWEKELTLFLLSKKEYKIIIDSWNNISKYTKVSGAFFIFDEQRLVGSGKWAQSFLKISKNNNWILLTATPGDNWLDYIPVFIANGFYKNRTEFLKNHAVFNNYLNFPKIDRFINTDILYRYKNKLIVNMEYKNEKIHKNIFVKTAYNFKDYQTVIKNRWNIYKNQPIQNASELCYTLRRVVNEDESRIKEIFNILKTNPKIILFYNFDYELDKIKTNLEEKKVDYSEWNGHKHQPIPTSDSWVYIVQYFAGAEGWNCVETNCVVFYSQSYSYKTMKQAAGRIDRLNSPFEVLYYYYLKSNSTIDLSIYENLKNKKDFNEKEFAFKNDIFA